MAGCLRTLAVRPERMQAALDPAMLATDLADYLVGRGVPFRQAHAVAGQAVRRAAELGVAIDRLPSEALKALHPAFEADVSQVFDFQAALARRAAQGGTAPQAVQAQLEKSKQLLAERD
jgi:argininosuccinate lyase